MSEAVQRWRSNEINRKDEQKKKFSAKSNQLEGHLVRRR